MLKELKAPQKDSQAWCNQSDHLQMAEDILAAVRRVRREVVDCMRVLMKYAKVMPTLVHFNILSNAFLFMLKYHFNFDTILSNRKRMSKRPKACRQINNSQHK